MKNTVFCLRVRHRIPLPVPDLLLLQKKWSTANGTTSAHTDHWCWNWPLTFSFRAVDQVLPWTKERRIGEDPRWPHAAQHSHVWLTHSQNTIIIIHSQFTSPSVKYWHNLFHWAAWINTMEMWTQKCFPAYKPIFQWLIYWSEDSEWGWGRSAVWEVKGRRGWC